jgi:hypothetical protein
MSQCDLKQYTAANAAARNYQLNLSALLGSQADLAAALAPEVPEAEWLLGRDGALTARVDGGWWSGCSLPLRAAQTLLEKLELGAVVSCFLSPTHAAQLRVTLDRLSASQAIVAVVPDAADLGLMLACDCFEAEIRGGRLWFVSGERWPEELERLLAANDGLPTPGQFIRTALVEAERLNEMIRAAQEVFSRELNRRGDVVRTLLTNSRPVQGGRVCVVAPGAFRLWDDAGGVLAMIAEQQGWTSIDPDDPRGASPVSLARAAAGCEVVVLANASRADLPADLSGETKVVSWVTGQAIPRFVGQGTADRLLVADPLRRAAVIAAGWPADRVVVAGWPLGWQALSPGLGLHNDEDRSERVCPCHPDAFLAIIADTAPIAAPDFELSSQNILWESIRREIAADPFGVGADVEAYLALWLTRVGIGDEAVDRAAFIQRLILPAYQQGLARWLMEAGVPVRLFGRGWDVVDGFAACHAGEITDRAGLRRAIQCSAALVHVWPGNGVHPIDATGRPVLRRASKTRELWTAEAKRMSKGEGRAPAAGGPELSAGLIRRAAGLTQAS